MTDKDSSLENQTSSMPEADKWTQSTEVKTDATLGKETNVADQAKGENLAWEREVISRMAFAAISEQRRARRWGIFFKSLGFIYVGVLLILMLPSGESSLTTVGKNHTALVEIKGVIDADSEASADAVISGLRDAFENKHTSGVILRINSPGGSPVQAGYINDEIKRLKALRPNIPVYAVIVDICASGGYYIAVAADKIYADKASLVGSIGVLMDGFGFVSALEKLGVERRLITAGDNKGFLDPFSPLKESDLAHVKTLLDNTHKQFINVVREGRGDRLAQNDQLFSGYIWSGEQSLGLGLIDGLGSSSYVARELIGEERIVDFTQRPSPLQNFADRIGVSAATVFADVLGLEKASLR